MRRPALCQHIDKRALNITSVQKRFRHFRSIHRGYAGLLRFGITIFAYCWVLQNQHRTTAVCGANSHLQIFFEKLKVDLKVADSASLYDFMAAKIVPQLLKGRWTSTTKNGNEIHGATTSNYYYVMGGIAITAIKGQSDPCFRGNPCYSNSQLNTSHYNMSLPGGGSFLVPRNDLKSGGYSVSIPSSTSDSNRKALLTAYKGLFGPDTRELWLHAVVFNPNGKKTVTSLAIGGTMSLSDDIKIFTKIQTIPYHLYEPDTKKWSIFVEISLIIYAVWAFVLPFLQYNFNEPVVEGTENDRLRWFKWSLTWRELPLRGGRPNVHVSAMLYLTLMTAMGIWFYLNYKYGQLQRFGSHGDLDFLFDDPLANTSSNLSEKIDRSIVAAQDDVVPFSMLIDWISNTTTIYFYVHVAGMLLCVARASQFLAFQKRLSAVSDTFSSVADDLIHMGFVFCLVCFLFGCANSLAFGTYDPAFKDFSTSFVEMVLVCFGMFKPSASVPFVLSLFKYTPHTVIDTYSASWMPLLLQIVFKIIVMLLLFKLLIGVIMDGYKKHAKAKLQFLTMREDMSELCVQTWHFLAGILLGRPWVPIFHVALAVGSWKPSKERPWEKFFIGLDSRSAVKDALNNVLSDDMPKLAREEVERHNLTLCSDAEVDYVLSAYGTNRRKAELQFAHLAEGFEARKLCKAKDSSPSNGPEPVEEDDETRAKELVNGQISALYMYRQELGSGHGKTWMQKTGPTISELKTIFEQYDFLNLGTIEHLFMPLLFKQLGFRIATQDLADVLIQYDYNEDGFCSFKEFKIITGDERLVGVWHSKTDKYSAESRKGIASQGSFSVPLLEAEPACVECQL